ncbi:MAG: VWA domain-containing protein [Verrucomicrobiota bacterium]
MTWAEPMLLFLVMVPLGFLVWEMLNQQRHGPGRTAMPSRMKLIDHAMGQGRAHRSVPRRKIYFWLAVAFLIIALARPQVGFIELPVFKKSRQVLIALDVSKSMLASDVTPSRLERSRLLVESLLDELNNEQVGLLLFAGSSFLQCPLSSDYEILKEFLPEVGPEYLPQGGTDYGRMMQAALEAFSTTGNADRFLIVLSDGESLDEGWKRLIPEFQEANIRTIGLGVGTREGAIVPDPDGGFIKQESGAAVLSRLESATLEELANQTNGRYVEAARWVDLGQLVQATVESGKAGDYTEQSERVPLERFQIPLAVSLFFFLMSLWREVPVRPRLKKLSPELTPLGNEEQEEVETKSQVPPPLPVGLVMIYFGFLATGSYGQLPNTQDPLANLTAAITSLSQKDQLDAIDLAGLAQSTIKAGQQEMGSDFPKGAIYDAIDAVQAGRKLDASAAPWDQLQAQLEQLLEDPPEQENQQQSQDQENQETEDHQENQENSSSSESDQSQNESSDESDQKSEDSDQKGDDSEDQNNENSSEENEADGKEDDESEGSNENTESQNENQPSGAENEAPEMNQDESASMGDLAENEEDSKQEKAEEVEETEREQMPPEESQQLGGGSSQGSTPLEEIEDPEMRRLLSRAEQLKNADNPGLIFQRMSGDEKPPTRKGKDW